ncbi:class I mannose-6-phosphate isomerase [Tumebacillus sp. ITR2]|uniref:Mannose-6-phosphate isomerase n=1 Tax=Tumebacillus amylolyticus TaxID=2801339 RepID=A0ABS1J4T3_9BACL|nr:type I phosphomannose isomerase catalytic subunit [Tumebacillus amylolyticus]MBL0385287.1 class I mannose-6-phosphate isomerase [Tumebacillus amylolyticus]
MRAYPVKFAPVIKPRVWGGDALKKSFGVETSEPIGEYWVLSGLPGDASVVVNGPLAGKTLVELIAEMPDEYLGMNQTQPLPQFPLLIKFLEAREHLSVQIHPDDEQAQAWEQSLGKTEAWYILDHEPGASVIYGHTFPSAETYWNAVRDGQVVDYLQELEIQRDQLIFVPSRTLHALKAGTTLIEIQQSSDITYRVYDWGRPRELHLEKAALSMTYGTPTENPNQRRTILEKNNFTHEHLLHCPYFTIEKLTLTDTTHTLEKNHPNPDILIVADGEGTLIFRPDHETVTSDLEPFTLNLAPGDTVLLPTSISSYTLTTSTQLTLLRTYYELLAH